MRTWHPKSWSEQARDKADLAYFSWFDAKYSNRKVYPGDEELHEKEKDTAFWVATFANSYRPPIIRYRAAKRFRRLVRKGTAPAGLKKYVKEVNYYGT